MKRLVLSAALFAPMTGLALWACTGDDDTFRPVDAGTPDGRTTVDAPVQTAPDAASAPTLACGDAGGAPPRVLLVQGNPRISELAAVNLQTNGVDGRLAFDGGYGVTSSQGTDPWLLNSAGDEVIRLDAREPWRAIATWNVGGADAPDGGPINANPAAVVPVGCAKAYVLRYNRNQIAIIDPSQPAGGAPKGWIDLSSFAQPGDPDAVEMTAAVYVPAKKKVFVVLGHLDLTRTVKVGELTKLLCAPFKPRVIAIDVETDALVSPVPGGPPSIELEGYNPPLGSPLAYDAAFDRLIVLQAGCNAAETDGGAGPIVRRRVEQVDLATGAVKTLLSLDGRGFPSSLAWVSGTQAAITFFGDSASFWDPTKTELGDPIPAGGIDIVAANGAAGFVGTRYGMQADGGFSLEVVKVSAALDGGSDASPAVLAVEPFTKPGGYVAGIEIWPRP